MEYWNPDLSGFQYSNIVFKLYLHGLQSINYFKVNNKFNYFNFIKPKII